MDGDNTISTLVLHDNPDYVLFKIAIHFAEKGLRIWFISISLFEKIPENIQQPCKEVLQLITFIYLKDYLDLVNHLNSIHKWNNIPNLIILKDFDRYCDLLNVEYNCSQAAFLCSSLLDCVRYLSRKNNSKTFLLVCSALNNHKNFNGRIQILYDMYFDKLLLNTTFESENDLIGHIENEFIVNKTT